MNIYPIELDFSLPDNKFIDIFIIQWHTPLLFNNNNWNHISPSLTRSKNVLLTAFKSWLTDYFMNNFDTQPLLILAPELSVSYDHIPILNEISTQINRPTIIIVGLEYLDWSQYEKIITEFQDMPQPDKWLKKNEQNNPAVNAAYILVRDNNGNVKKFIQPKIHPQDHESMYLNSGENVLFFNSINRMNGYKFDFITQICSDFTSARFVTDLREAIESEINGSSIDMTFLLQCNEDQTAEQFQQAFQMYFDKADKMAKTNDGCLVSINNANSKMGKTLKWGYSKFHFPAKRWRTLSSPPNTYFIKNDNAHNHQEIIFREHGPSIYWVTYKPHNMVREISGSGEPKPFSKAKHAPIKDINFGYSSNNDGRFLDLPAVCHWFNCVLVDLGNELNEQKKAEEDIKTKNINPDVFNLYFDSFKKVIKEWNENISNKENLACSTLNAFFQCKNNYSCEYFESAPLKQIEPQNWCKNASTYVKRMMQTHALLQLGIETIPNQKITLSLGEYKHAKDNKNVTIIFLSGCQKRPREIITNYFKNQQLVEMLFDNVILILINPSAEATSDEMKSFIKNATPDITKADDFDEGGNSITHLINNEIRSFTNLKLPTQLDVADSRDDFLKKLNNIISEFFNGEHSKEVVA